MLLFANDWKRYPNAIIDINTTNTSFVRLAALYRSMGIENNSFMLALLNPALQGVNPHSTTLTIEQMALIAIECKNNPWYFMREVVRVPGIGSTEPTMLDANRGNVALYWCFFNHVFTFLIQIRQTGKTLTIRTIISLLMNIVCTNSEINLLTKDDGLRKETIEGVKEITALLPKYLQQNTRQDAANTEEITVKRLGNKLKAHVPQASPKAAYKVGRGLTSPIMFIDEGPFQQNIKIALGSALGATGAAVDKAKLNNAPYCTILTTTAGKKDDRDGGYVYSIMMDAAQWSEKLFDCTDELDLENTVKRNSRGGVFRVNITLNHRQLGKSDEWLKGKLDAALANGEDADRDYFNIWTSGTQTNPLSNIILGEIAKSQVDSIYTDISKPHGYITRWYIPENEITIRLNNGKFILSLDTSEAAGGDDIAFTMLDVETLEIMAVGTYNETNLITFSEWICSILVEFVNITAIIERRSTGGMIMDYLLLMLPQHGVDPFKRLFNRVVQDYDEFPDRFKEIQVPMGRRSTDIYVKYKKSFGFATAASGYASRSELYSTTLQNAAKRSATRIKDKFLIGQILGLINKNGRIDHADGEHDDLVISWLLGHWLLTQGKQLEFYGIDSSRVMSAIAVKTNETIADLTMKVEQDIVRNKIQELFTKLTKEQDDFVSMRIENELRVLDKKIILEAGEIYSLDSLIKQAGEAKRNRRRSFGSQNNNTNSYRDGYASGYLVNNSGSFSDTPFGR